MGERTPFVPPRWFVTTAWRVHRAIARRGPGRGLWTTEDKRGWGSLTLTTRGRRSGEPRLPGERAAAVRYAVLGTILTEPLLLALRRLAQQDASARRLRRE
ncbi:hypothetical protein GCM10027064_06410 [Microbacterium petrolearium]